ncbi:MAG: hypothetical protein VXZ40_01185 [Nanoarchaeota archaeon]|nr:hypothetical protein [Nanoarchaeota archaeon]
MMLLFLFPIQLAYAFNDPSPQQGTQVASVCDGGLNIRDNLILSTVTLCIPGILENVEEFNQIQCEEVVCTYTSIANGVPADHCSKQAAYRVCANVLGDIFALPGFNIIQFIDGFKQAIATYLTNPYVLFITGLRQWGKTCSGTCDIYQLSGSGIILAVNDLAAAAQRIVSIFDQGFSPQRGPDYCAQVEDLGIRDEVDKILEVDN